MIGSVERGEELRVVRLPSAKPIAGLEEESVTFLFRAEGRCERLQSSRIIA